MARPGFLTEDNGVPSSMRLMNFIALIAAISFASFTLYQESANANNTSTSSGRELTLLFLASAFAPKVMQKALENKFSITENIRTEPEQQMPAIQQTLMLPESTLKQENLLEKIRSKGTL